MRLDQLEYGMTEKLQVEPHGAETTFPSSLRDGTEIHLWLDENSDSYYLQQGQALCPIRGASAKDERALERLCGANVASISWFVRRQSTGSGTERALAQVHQFAHHCIGAIFDLAIDDKVVEATSRRMRIRPNIAHVIARLTDECMLPVTGGDDEVRVFLSAGMEVVDMAANAFVLHGRSMRVFVRRMNQPDHEDHGKLRVESVVCSRGNDARHPIVLGVGKIQFRNHTDSNKALVLAQAQLSQALKAENRFIRIWEQYGQFEADVILAGARVIGALRYESFELVAGLVRFNLSLEEKTEGLTRIMPRDELEVSDVIPDFIQNPNITWNDLAPGPVLKSGKDAFVGTVTGAVDLQDITLKPSRRALIDDLPESGFLFLSLHGDRIRLNRRRNAQEAIRTARCPMPQLGLLLEGSVIPPGRHIWHEGMTPRVRRKVFAKHPPTAAQLKAIETALNTPDIAVIQGPPGTGKTTVLRAIIERLNEINERSNNVAGEFLVTGIQHDAVENALDKLTVNDLPAIKFGRKQDQDTFSAAEISIERWRTEKIAQLETVNAPASPEVQWQLRGLILGYIQAPGTIKETIDLLRRVSDLLRAHLPYQVTDSLGTLRHQLESEARHSQTDQLTAKAARRAVRAIRTTAEAFSDDGPITAIRARNHLARIKWLDKEAEQLLEQAGRWPHSDGPPPFMGQLEPLRRHLLLRFGEEERTDSQPKVRQDIASLLAQVQAALREQFRRTREAPEAVAAEYLHRLKTDVEALGESIAACTTVFGATCQHAAGHIIARAKAPGPLVYDSVLVDEAARANPLDLFIPMTQARRRIILIGDHRQLPHVIDREIQRQLESVIAEDDASIREKVEETIKQSIFMHLFKQAKRLKDRDGLRRTITLDKQYRMHPTLGEFISRVFYNPYSESFGSPLDARHFKHNLPGYRRNPAAWLHVPECGDETRGKSKSRPSEATVVANELSRLMEDDATRGLSFGVITFYKAQERLIRKRLRERGVLVSEEHNTHELALLYHAAGVAGVFKCGWAVDYRDVVFVGRRIHGRADCRHGALTIQRDQELTCLPRLCRTRHRPGHDKLCVRFITVDLAWQVRQRLAGGIDFRNTHFRRLDRTLSSEQIRRRTSSCCRRRPAIPRHGRELSALPTVEAFSDV